MSGGAAVVADIGGTKGRFAIADLESLRLSCVRSSSCAHFASPEAVFTGYRRDAGELPSLAAIAVAGPVAGGRVRMSNLDWEITLDDIGQWLGVKKVLLLNDFEAAAQALPVLGQEALVTLRHGEASGRRNLALLGPGTGLGVAGLVPASHGWQAVAGGSGAAAGMPPSRCVLSTSGASSRRSRPGAGMFRPRFCCQAAASPAPATSWPCGRNPPCVRKTPQMWACVRCERLTLTHWRP